jgi:hypothetical protein
METKMSTATFPAVKAVRQGSTGLLLTFPVDTCWSAFAQLPKGASEGYVKVTLSRPGRPRTTGEGSQNHRINGHCQLIAMELGYEFDEIKMAMKLRAISRGYPFATVLGQIIPKSEADLTTEEAAFLIDTIDQFAAEFGIRLPE